jgi:hypothetical protein
VVHRTARGRLRSIAPTSLRTTRRSFSSHSGSQSHRKRSRGNSSISCNSRATCALGLTTKSCAWTTRIQKLNDSARVCRSFRIGLPSVRKIARDLSKQSKPGCASGKVRSMSFRSQKTPNVQRRTPNAEPITGPSAVALAKAGYFFSGGCTVAKTYG